MRPVEQVVGLVDRQHPDRPGHRGHADADGGRLRGDRERAACGWSRTSSTTSATARAEASDAAAGRLAGGRRRDDEHAEDVVAEGNGHARPRCPATRSPARPGRRRSRTRRAATRTRATSRRSSASCPAHEAAARDPRRGRRAARRDLGRRRRGAGVLADRAASTSSTSTAVSSRTRLRPRPPEDGTPGLLPEASISAGSARVCAESVPKAPQTSRSDRATSLARLRPLVDSRRDGHGAPHRGARARATSLGALRSRSRTWRTTRERSTRAALFFCVPGTRADGHDFAAEAVAQRRRGARRRATARARRAAARRRRPRARDGGRGRRVLRRPDRGARGRRRHRHERQDDDRVPRSTRSSPRPGDGPVCSARSRAASAASADRRRANDARGDRPAADVPRDARRAATAAARWRRRRTAPSWAGSTASASRRSSSRT